MYPFIIAVMLLAFSSLGHTKVNTENCVGCHSQAVSDWQTSDHAKAMDIATEKTVLANFNDAVATHHTQTAKFYKKDNQFRITFTEGNTTTDYLVSYTFGHYPLQQYLIETTDKRYQVFPFAWDSRPKTEGGQQWYPIYPEEDILPADRLHWQQPLQNWNGMCADCHSDGLVRNYLVKSDSFDTKFDNINVGCQSCHGLMPDHTSQKITKTTYGLNATDKQLLGQWLRKPEQKVAKWIGPKRDNAFMDNCFACHSLRTPLTDGIVPNTAFLDQFSPSLLSQPLYFADGQIKEEVYVYGSFLQSKMFRAGVNCLDCHNPHSMKLKVEGNALCLQCHSAEAYQQPKHLNHPVGSEGAQCVSCHMPDRTYMGVDDRRDHSFKIPRPAISAQFDSPNSCNGCHQDKSVDWAEKQVAKLYGNANKLTDTEHAYIQLQHQYRLPPAQHIAVIKDTQLNELVRASALALLPNSLGQLNDQQIQAWVYSSEPLIRLAVAQIGYSLPVNERLKSYQKLLSDEYRVIRVQAATHLALVGADHSNILASAIKELMTSNQVSMWRGEGGLNQSMLALNLGKVADAISALKHAIQVDPYFPAPYVNLADIYRQSQSASLELETYQQGLLANPKSAVLHYSYGLSQIRNNQKSASLKSFELAVKYDPSNVQYAYVYFVALDSLGRTKQALAQLRMVIGKYTPPRQLAELGLGFAQKLGDRAAYQYFQGFLR